MEAVEAVKLPESAPGHWDTAEGREMALEYVGKGRTELAYGHVSDLALANAIFMVNRDDLELIHYQEAAKQRIRWLSARLAAYEANPTEIEELREAADWLRNNAVDLAYGGIPLRAGMMADARRRLEHIADLLLTRIAQPENRGGI